MKKKYSKLLVMMLCMAVLTAFSACQSSRSASPKHSSYQKDRVRYNPHWNSATSPTTTYHIKKHFKRNPRDRKKSEY